MTHVPKPFDPVAETRKAIKECDVIGRSPDGSKGACFRCVLEVVERALRVGKAAPPEDAPGPAWRRLRTKERGEAKRALRARAPKEAGNG